MAKETAQSSGIQLLPKERFYEAPTSQLLSRLLNVTYYILIFTLGLVLLVFLSRFWLDARIIDLKRIISNKAQMVQGAQEFESMFLETQKLLAESASLQDSLAVPSKYFTVVEETIPQEAILTRLSLTSEGLTIKGKTLSYQVVTAFIQALENREEFVKVNLESLERGEQGQAEEEGEQEITIQEVLFEIIATWQEKRVIPQASVEEESGTTPEIPGGL